MERVQKNFSLCAKKTVHAIVIKIASTRRFGKKKKGMKQNKKISLKQDIGNVTNIFISWDASPCEGSGEWVDRKQASVLEIYSCTLSFSRCLSLRPNGNEAVKLSL